MKEKIEDDILIILLYIVVIMNVVFIFIGEIHLEVIICVYIVFRLVENERK